MTHIITVTVLLLTVPSTSFTTSAPRRQSCHVAAYHNPTLLLLQAQKPADTASDWKEFTSPDGRKYYHNRKTKESKWVMPEEMKRAQAAAAAAATANGTGQGQKAAGSAPPQLVKVPVAQSLSPARTSSTPAQKSPLVMAGSLYSHHPVSSSCCTPCSIHYGVVWPHHRNSHCKCLHI